MRSQFHQPARRGALLLLVATVTIAACGSSDSANPPRFTQPSGRGSTTTLRPSDRPLVSQTTVAANDDQTIAAGTVDLTGAPAFTVTSNDAFLSVSGGALEYSMARESSSWGVLSPDGKHVAVAKRSDAVRAASLEILATDSGKRVQSFDIDTTDVEVDSWALDSSAVLLQQQSSDGVRTHVVYYLDGSKDPLPDNQQPNGRNDARWASTATQVKWANCKNSQSACYPGYQLTTGTGKLVYVAYKQDATMFGRFDGAKGVLVPLPGDGGTAQNATACGRYAVLYRSEPGVGSAPFAVYDSETDKVKPVPKTVEGCPVASSDGTSLAFSQQSGPVAVNAAGKATQIAREGTPIAWSQDGQSVLVKANSGTFRVEADGSGGKEASAQMEGICVINSTGKVLASVVGRGVVAYDIGSDSATTITDSTTLRDTCSVTNDGRWVYSGGQLFDIDKGVAGLLENKAGGSPQLFDDFRWQVPATTAPIVGA